MADFTSVTTKRDQLNSATQILNTLQIIYGQCQAVQALLARYNTDTAFKAQVDYVFSPSQLSEIATMITNVNTLQGDWATNHKGPLNL